MNIFHRYKGQGCTQNTFAIWLLFLLFLFFPFFGFFARILHFHISLCLPGLYASFTFELPAEEWARPFFRHEIFLRFIYINLILKWILKAGCRKKNYMLLKIRKQYQDSTVKCNSHRSYFQCWITHPSIKIVRRRRNRILGFSFEKKEISFLFV